MIRSVPANPSDSLFCMLLAQNAVHGAMAGYTCFTTGLCCNRTVYLPIPALVENSPRRCALSALHTTRHSAHARARSLLTIVCSAPPLSFGSMDKAGRTWERVISVTGQPNRPAEKNAAQEHAVQPATIF